MAGQQRVDVQADLQCEFDGRPITVRATAGKIVISVPDLATGLKLIRAGGLPGSISQRLRKLQNLLSHSLLSIECRVGEVMFASLGHDVGTRWWNLIGLPRMTLKPITVAALYVRGG